MRVRTRYAKSGRFNVAYQVLGAGARDLVVIPIWVSHLEAAWEYPPLAAFYRRLASFARVIVFDKRGTGLSDRVPDDVVPTLEDRMDDVVAVMGAAGSEQAALFGMHEGGAMAALFAATHPERANALVTFGMFARRLAADDFPLGWTAERRREWLEQIERDWGDPVGVEEITPTAAADPGFREWWARYLRVGASPGAARALAEMNSAIDVRDVLPSVRVPTLVLHRAGDRRVSVQEARWIADRIPRARLVELPGEDHLPWVGDQDAVLDEVEEFLTGVRRGPDPDRVLATLLFTDVVESTRRAAEVGDRAWRELIEAHDELVRDELRRWRGEEVDSTGDGVFAAFDGPARAIRCALALAASVRSLGLEIRAGVHTGEVERTSRTLRGISVHIAARVAARAAPGEVLVSHTVKDLIVGSGIALAERGEHVLKGAPGTWRLYAAAG
ncbi:MAG: adenylate/guanylate cyclase domain-containing protein [Thermoleophilia bacterium]|nr:adenylate/guanylate cyclase domain-containing protein [Thermoleophilia bacterium]